jgi:mannose-6-phosphate isomerase-like protein (cupin superfamily)
MTYVINNVELPLSGTVRFFEGFQYGDIHVSFLLVELPPGDGPDLHTHPYEEIFVVQEGQVTFTVGDATIEATGGQIVIGPAGTPHKFVNSGTGPLRQINIHPSPRMITAWLQDGESAP